MVPVGCEGPCVYGVCRRGADPGCGGCCNCLGGCQSQYEDQMVIEDLRKAGGSILGIRLIEDDTIPRDEVHIRGENGSVTIIKMKEVLTHHDL